MMSGDFTAVKGVRYNLTDTWSGVADTVLVTSKAVLKESKQNKLVYRLPAKHIKTLKAASGSTYDYTFQYQKEFDVSLSTTDGTASLTVSGNETFPYSGTLTDTQKRDIIVVAKQGFTQNSATVETGEHIDMTSNNSNASVTVVNSTSITIFDDLGNPTIATMFFIKTQTASATDPTNKFDTRLVINDTNIAPDFVSAVDDAGKQIFIDEFGIDLLDIDVEKVEGAKAWIYDSIPNAPRVIVSDLDA
mgnify:CR=1 FL=1